MTYGTSPEGITCLRLATSLVEGGYKDARSAELPAAVVAWSEIREMRLGKINRYGNEMGLRPLDP